MPSLIASPFKADVYHIMQKIVNIILFLLELIFVFFTYLTNCRKEKKEQLFVRWKWMLITKSLKK